MQQSDLPMYEGPEDALKAAVLALGGSKKVGPMIWPAKGIDAASRLLLDCLNPARAEKLDLTQSIFILKAARDVGCYAPFQWVAGEVGFDASPISRDAVVDRLTNVISDASRSIQLAVDALDRIKRDRSAHD